MPGAYGVREKQGQGVIDGVVAERSHEQKFHYLERLGSQASVVDIRLSKRLQDISKYFQ
jgi:hypothetical protein